MRLIDTNELFKKTCNTPLYDNRDEDIFLDLILDAPEIKAKPIIYAHWILEREPNGNPYCYHCSHCDADFHNIGIKCATKYCPDCGATMSERIEDNGKID